MAQDNSAKQRQAQRKTAKSKPHTRSREIAFSLGLFDRTLISLSIKVSTTGGHKQKTKKKTKRQSFKKEPTSKFLLTDRRSLATLFIVAVGIIGSLFFAYNLALARSPAQPLPKAPVVTSPQSYQPKSLNKSDAVTLRIPSIGVDSGVIKIGKSSDGSIESPRVFDQVGQYALGPTPGEIGPAVIVGHVDSLTGPAVFWRLRELSPGQDIEIVRQDGSVAKFRVDRIAEYSQDDFPTDQVYGNTGNAELRLITCSGAFNIFTGKYSNNTVVYATLV